MKSFFNNAVIGNSKILATLDDKSQILRIFWPHIDYAQHIDKFLLGIYFPNVSNTIHWIDSSEWHHVQYYIEDTNILRTVITSSIYELSITLTDFVAHDNDVIIRNIEIQNISEENKDINFSIYCSGTRSKTDLRSSMFDYDSDSIVLYRHNNYVFIGSDKKCSQFQLTNNPFDACNRMFLYGVEDYSLAPEGAMIYELGNFKPNEIKKFNLYISFGDTLNSTRQVCLNIKNVPYDKLLNSTKKYWHSFLKTAKSVKTGYFDIDTMYKRSLLVLRLMSDENGGIIATPEFDEESHKSGKYGFCWPRDAAFITTALDRVGLIKISRKFYEWALKAQDNSGVWHQRYYIDGNLAPSWGLQYDETGSILWAMWEHYLVTKDIDFLNLVWNSVYKGAEYLLKVIDRNVGIPGPTYDIWEMRYGEHCYTSAAVYGGLLVSSKIAKELKKDNFLIEKWRIEAENIKMSIEKSLWDESFGRYLKSINTKLNPWGEEQGETINVIVNKKGYWRTFAKRDENIDASILGLIIPYNVFSPDDPKIQKTVQIIEEKLTNTVVGGLKRFEDDDYIGGNPWIITTLWLAMYYIKIKKFESAKELLIWAVNHKTKLGVLPEQIDKNTGEPAWVIPLTWSHAMFIHVLFDLIDEGVL